MRTITNITDELKEKLLEVQDCFEAFAVDHVESFIDEVNQLILLHRRHDASNDLLCFLKDLEAALSIHGFDGVED